MRYTDKDITFYLVVYKDYERAVWCLDKVRVAYPEARIVIDVDGDKDERWALCRHLYNAEVNYGKRLFKLKYGGAIVKRMLEHHVNDPAHRRWLFRIDTDTEIRRRFKYLPVHDYFGHYYKWRNFIQGGCIGLTRNVAARILKRGCLDRRDLATNPMIWQERKDTAHGRVGKYGLVSFDWLLNWAMCQLKVRGRDFPEVRSTWRDAIPAEVDCAVAHPCKDIPVRRPI